MWSPSIQRLIILLIVIVILLKFFFFSENSPELSETKRDLRRPYVFDAIMEANPLWVDEEEEKKFLFYKQIAAFANASNNISVIEKRKTAVCEMDTYIGQQVLCSLQQKDDEEEPCDSDSITRYKNFNELAKKEKLDKNLTDWKILFPRRNPVERIVDHFIDTCVRESRPCFDCRLNIKCYLTIIHSVIKDLHKKIDLLIDDHMKYIPQNWFCQMETMSQRLTFVDYEFFANPTNPEFADAKRPDKFRVEEFFDDPVSSYEKIRQYYTTLIHVRPDILDLVKKIYYWDFLLLKLPLPELRDAATEDFKDGWH